MGLIVCVLFTMWAYFNNTYIPRGILMVQLLLIFFQLVNRFFIQCMAIIFYVFILLYVTFGGVNAAISTTISVREKWKQSEKAALHSWLR